MLLAFERLLSDPSSGSRMAELARTLGEKRLCKLDVDMVTLPVAIYCIEHEQLQSSLALLRIMVGGVCVYPNRFLSM